MPSSDYTASTGALKLKGAAGVTKSKKKKKPKPSGETTESSTVVRKDTKESGVEKQEEASEPRRNIDDETREQLEKDKAAGRVKTEAELRFEENKRKRLEERLKRDGVKTHKVKVEELNRYLSGLSEHHDMPRIGPG